MHAFALLLRRFGAVAAAACCLSQAAPAAAALETSPLRVLGVTSTRIQLPPIRLEELADRGVVPLADAPRTARHTGGALVANGQLNLPPIRTQITRTIRSAWSMRVPAARSMNTTWTRVEARLESSAGSDRLADPAHPESGIPVSVRAQPAQVVSMDKSATTLQGDIELTLDLQDITAAGHYTGRLIITLEGT